MTTIIFYSNTLRDVVAPSRTLMLQAGRGGDPEHFWISNGIKSVYLDPVQANEFLSALDKMNRCVQAGKLADKEFYSGEIHSYDGHKLGIDLGVRVGRPFLALEDVRIDISVEDLSYFAAACRPVHHLAGGIGPASRVARSVPMRIGPANFASRYCGDGSGRNWYD